MDARTLRFLCPNGHLGFAPIKIGSFELGVATRPDFIVLDVLMPEMDGLATLAALMQIDRSLNVIMLSCSNEVGTVVEASGDERVIYTGHLDLAG